VTAGINGATMTIPSRSRSSEASGQGQFPSALWQLFGCRKWHLACKMPLIPKPSLPNN